MTSVWYLTELIALLNVHAREIYDTEGDVNPPTPPPPPPPPPPPTPISVGRLYFEMT